MFGYVKGAVPGSEKGKKGTLESAAGGVLFINGFHKLPAKAQNMLIDVIETGAYFRLGEHSVAHSADFMMIFSTDTEGESAELNRLTGIIPNVIQLPDLEQRNISEKLEYLFDVLFEEANLINKTISIHKDMIRYLLSLSYQGNIAQLKSEIKKICATAYADNHPAQNNIEIGFQHITFSERTREFISPQKQTELAQMLELEEQDNFVFIPGIKPRIPIGPNQEAPDQQAEGQPDFEEILSAECVDSGVEYDEMHISQYVSKLASLDKAITRLQSSRLINPLIEQSVRRILIKQQRYNRFMERKQLYYGLLLHLTKVIKAAKYEKRTNDFEQDSDSGLEGKSSPNDFEIAKAIVDTLNTVFNVKIKNQEIEYIALYISLSLQWLAENVIGLLLLCRGRQTAECMAQYVNEVLGKQRVNWLNYDENEAYEIFQSKVADMIGKIDQGSGVLILSDMEPLASIHLQMTHLVQNSIEGISDISMSKLIDIAQYSMNPSCSIQAIKDHARHLQTKNPEAAPSSNKYSQLINRVINEMLTVSLTFIDPAKVAYSLLDSLGGILKEIDLPYMDEIAIKFIFHCAVMFERVIKKEPFAYNRLKTFINKNNALITVIDKHLSETAEIFGVTIPTSELAYVADIFLPYMVARKK
ncbi:MAG: PRD domain-containing protein [Clostridiales bacterium]|nr:PRD domain-containing protein [Clostridiales bacterium]